MTVSVLRDNLPTFVFGALFIFALGYAIWLRFWMYVSKARFAFAVIGAFLSCFFVTISFLGGILPVQIASSLLTQFGFAPLQSDNERIVANLIVVVLAIFISNRILSFGRTAIHYWDGPHTLTINELAKTGHENSIIRLAITEAKRIIWRLDDLILTNETFDWKNIPPAMPDVLPWHEFAKDLFQSVFPETLFSQSSWRDRYGAWIGKEYTDQTNTRPIILFVFGASPEFLPLLEKMHQIKSELSLDTRVKCYAVFDDSPAVNMELAIEGVEFWSRSDLLKRSLHLENYARDLIRRFEEYPVGGTAATLKATYVETQVVGLENADPEPLSLLLEHWVGEKHRGHLALTGEYGQGKSTAMLKFCASWARRYLKNPSISEKIPLLIELRGMSPADTDILAIWASRYGLQAKRLNNLIKAGEAILIFEGFDELHNAGHHYNRHEHFNALWRNAFPGTKIIFTGRPNFFLDDAEQNQTLRIGKISSEVGFTHVYTIEKLRTDEIKKVLYSIDKRRAPDIVSLMERYRNFEEILSRPSMIPVVVSIWERIEASVSSTHGVNSSIIMDKYLTSVYERRDAELRGEQGSGVRGGNKDLFTLPIEVREAFSLVICWNMVTNDARNTITREKFDEIIGHVFEDILLVFQGKGNPANISRRVQEYENHFLHETRGEKIERIATEVASAGVFVKDVAGGASNLCLPHKQFYEYMIAKGALAQCASPSSLMTNAYRKSIQGSNVLYTNLLKEPNSLRYLSEMIGNDFKLFKSAGSRAVILLYTCFYYISLWLPISYFDALDDQIRNDAIDYQRGDYSGLAELIERLLAALILIMLLGIVLFIALRR